MDPSLSELVDEAGLQKVLSYKKRFDSFHGDFWHNAENRKAFEEISQEISKADPDLQTAFVLQTIDQIGSFARKLRESGCSRYQYMNLNREVGYPAPAAVIMQRLFVKKLCFNERQLLFMLNRTADVEMVSAWSVPYLKFLVRLSEEYLRKHEMTKQLNLALARAGETLSWIANAPERKLRERIRRLREEPKEVPIVPGEAWSDRALADLESMSGREKTLWMDLLEAGEAAGGGQPTAKWLKRVEKLMDEIGRSEFKKRVLSWFPLVDKPRTQIIESWPQWQPNPNLIICDINASVLKGLVWCCSFSEDRETARALRTLAISAYRKVPGLGPRAVKIGNACIYSLGAMRGMEGIGQLALLKVKVRFRTALKLIDKALTATAERLGIAKDDLEEMSVPAYGLTDVGVLEDAIGPVVAQLRVTGTSTTELRWIKKDGKTQKSVPAEVKLEYKAELKELKSAAKDISKMLPAQRTRIENLYLRKKSWPYPVWKERYLDHPLVGTLARRLIWKFRTANMEADGIFLNGRIVDVRDKIVQHLYEDTVVSLWHPIYNVSDYVLAWRRWLTEHEIVQPFKQAHREIYVLTDAERQTRIYSNRYAAHIVKQHQFNALCAARGWHNVLKLLVDDEFPPASICLPEWNMRAEFWTDGVGDEYGVDTNEQGTYNTLATDQVRFFPIDAARVWGHASSRGQIATEEPILLENIEPLVFSEVMRDADLFVGVASVGNDPTWYDGGPGGRYQDYWTSYSFGDLSATAQTRKDILEGLVGRLKIADRCSVEGKFLRVRGDIRTYKIHMGSGNILMEPNDQYLCIVASRGQAKGGASSTLFLPFEGDNMLSVILSKAFLLAEDKKIKDTTIIRQIKV